MLMKYDKATQEWTAERPGQRRAFRAALDASQWLERGQVQLDLAEGLWAEGGAELMSLAVIFILTAMGFKLPDASAIVEWAEECSTTLTDALVAWGAVHEPTS